MPERLRPPRGAIVRGGRVVTAVFAGLAFFGAMGLIASLGGSHGPDTTRHSLWSVAAVLVGIFGLLFESARVLFW